MRPAPPHRHYLAALAGRVPDDDPQFAHRPEGNDPVIVTSFTSSRVRGWEKATTSPHDAIAVNLPHICAGPGGPPSISDRASPEGSRARYSARRADFRVVARLGLSAARRPVPAGPERISDAGVMLHAGMAEIRPALPAHRASKVTGHLLTNMIAVPPAVIRASGMAGNGRTDYRFSHPRPQAHPWPDCSPAHN